MRNTLVTILFFFTIVAANAQYRMVGYGSWIPGSLGSDSTYYCQVLSLKPDLTGFEYYGTQIADSMRVFTGTEQLYTIDSIGSQGFGFVELWIKEFSGFDGAPSGEVLIFDPDGRQTIPNLPFGSSGATSQLSAAINTYNARLIGQAEGVIVDTTGLIYVESTVLQGAIVDLDSAIATAAGSIDSLELQGDTMLRISLSGDGVPMKELDLSALNVTPTLAEVSSFSDDAAKSTYTMSAGVPVEFESSDNNTVLYIDETNERVGIGTNSPTEKLSVSSRIRVNNGILDMKDTDVYLGLDAGNSQLTHFNNFFAGYRAGSMANSFANTMVGGDAGRLNTGNRNTFLGAFAGENATSSESVVIGSTAGRNSAPGSSVVIGSEAGIDATGNKNVIIGYRSGSVNAASNNVFVGASAGAANTSGFNNLFLGYEAGKKVTTGNNNTIIGTGNVSNLTTGSTNTVIGSSNARDLTSGQFNTIIGTLSGINFQGASNLLLGYQSLFNDTLSNNSIVIGNGAAYHSYNTSSSVFLGNAAGPSTAKSISSKLYISNTAGAPTIYGDLSTKNIGIGQETACTGPQNTRTKL